MTTSKATTAEASLMPCCARFPSEIPRVDRLTMDPSLVTCTGSPS